jgi:heme/copper-type cytochrome/quinol oxidase subunit 1
MTTIDTHATGAAVPSGSHGVATTSADSVALVGVAGWSSTTDHKRIGRMFIGVSLAATIAVAGLGVVLALGRISTSHEVLGADLVPQLFSAYRVTLIFAVLVPVVLGLALAVVPLQLGARSLAFPRLAALGFWLWLAGLVLVVVTIAANGGPAGGNRRMVQGFLAAHIVLVLGLLAAAASLTTTVLTTRAPGMNMRRVPPFSFAALVAGLASVVGLPVVIGAMIFSLVDYRYGGSAFGGSKLLWDHIGFGFTQPFAFVFAVPAFGVAIDALATATGKRLPRRGTVFTGFGLIGLGVLGAVTQFPADLRRNLFDQSFGTALNDILPYLLIQGLPILGALVVLGVGAMALATSRPRVSAGMVFGLLGSLLIIAGMLANAVFHIGDAQLGGTVFEEGTRLLVAYGAVLAVLGGVAHWGPKLSGRTMPTAPVVPLALLGFVATALAAGPYLIAGFAKQPADATVFDYGGPQGLWNVLALIGHALMAATLLGFIGMAISAFTSDDDARRAGDDPWDGQTLEWATSSPAPEGNFAEVPLITSPEPLLDLKENAGRTA